MHIKVTVEHAYGPAVSAKIPDLFICHKATNDNPAAQKFIKHEAFKKFSVKFTATSYVITAFPSRHIFKRKSSDCVCVCLYSGAFYEPPMR